jgi:hypothetical protein
MVAGAVPIERTYSLPVQILALPSELALEAVEPPTVDVTFRGPRRSLQLAPSPRFQIAIDTTLARLGRRTFAVRPQDVQYPEGVELLEIEPPKIVISVRADE